MAPKCNNFYGSCIPTKFHQFLFNSCTDIHIDTQTERQNQYLLCTALLIQRNKNYFTKFCTTHFAWECEKFVGRHLRSILITQCWHLWFVAEGNSKGSLFQVDAKHTAQSDPWVGRVLRLSDRELRRRTQQECGCYCCPVYEYRIILYIIYVMLSMLNWG